MTKISHYMRVTKQPKAHGKNVDASLVVKKKHTYSIDEKKTKKQSNEESEAYVPTFIYETVKYKHKHEKHEVSKEMKIVIEYIQKYYDVPKDFEQNAKFGCYSGLTYEKRVARAYSLGQLSIKCDGKKSGIVPKPICLTCATVGHTYKNCPEGF